jgi:diaminohydroxyphosphoribosylaminopyrimidine deaminase/5-amino-6-(5-phosphoribosylamino)uracil reductase
MKLALGLARRGYGATSPNPMVGAVLVKGDRILGRGWHKRAGQSHAEIEALKDAQRRGHSPRGTTLYVTLEPCSTRGRTPPCTEAIIHAGVRRVVAGATDPNPRHRGRGFGVLRRAGLEVTHGVLADECERLNEAFNHWIVHRMPLVIVKAAMTLDGKIATAAGDSKWITGEQARARGMEMRRGVDAVLVGINTILADDPSLTVRVPGSRRPVARKPLRRIVLDAMARTPLNSKVVADASANLTTIVVSRYAPARRVKQLARKVRMLVAPASRRHSGDSPSSIRLDLAWLLRKLGAEDVTNVLVEGGGEVNASFLLGGFAHRIAFFYAPKILGGRASRKAVAGEGAANLAETLTLTGLKWERLGQDWLLQAELAGKNRI